MFGTRYTPLQMVGSLISLFIGLAVIALGLRVVLRLFGANPSADFVEWVYKTSDTLVSPFRGIFPSAEFDPGNVLDFTALFAMVIYALLGYLLFYILAWLTPTTRKTR